MECVVGKPQLLGVRAKAGNASSKPFCFDFLESLHQHGVIQIGGDDMTVIPHAGLNQ
jgi:hypothetical protein